MEYNESIKGEHKSPKQTHTKQGACLTMEKVNANNNVVELVSGAVEDLELELNKNVIEPISEEDLKLVKKIQQSFSNVSAMQLAMMEKQGKLHFDLAIQRNEVWDDDRAGLYIHSIIYGYPVPPVYALNVGDNDLWFLDGKQRLTKILKFKADKFALPKSTPSIGGYKLAGKTYSLLPEEIKMAIDSHTFMIFDYKNMSDEEIETMFLRMQNGMPLTKIELIRVIAGTDVMQFVQLLGDMKFWNEAIAINDKSKNRFVDEEVLLQTMAIVENSLLGKGDGVEIDAKSLLAYAEDLRANGLKQEVKDAMVSASEYLSKAFLRSDKNLKKTHIPMVVLQSIKAIQMGIKHEQFGGWYQLFHEHLATEGKKPHGLATYNNATGAGSAKKGNVKARIESMDYHFMVTVKDAPLYDIKKSMTAKELKAYEKEQTEQAKALAEAQKEDNGVSLEAIQASIEQANENLDKEESVQQ